MADVIALKDGSVEDALNKEQSDLGETRLNK